VEIVKLQEMGNGESKREHERKMTIISNDHEHKMTESKQNHQYRMTVSTGLHNSKLK